MIDFKVAERGSLRKGGRSRGSLRTATAAPRAPKASPTAHRPPPASCTKQPAFEPFASEPAKERPGWGQGTEGEGREGTGGLDLAQAVLLDEAIGGEEGVGPVLHAEEPVPGHVALAPPPS